MKTLLFCCSLMLLDIISPTKRCTRNIFGDDVETMEVTQPTQDTPTQDTPAPLQDINKQ